MNIRLWLRLFWHQLSMLGLILLGLLLLLVEGFALIAWQDLLTLTWLNIPVYLLVLALLVTIAAFYSAYLALNLSQPYEMIQAQLSWLLMGKYQHPIFKEKPRNVSWYETDNQVCGSILGLRQKLLQLHSDLQELSAAPTFVSQETKEEIIEGERHRIARELHDSVSQQLFAATMLISLVREQMEEGASQEVILKQVGHVESIVQKAQSEMRALLLHLRPIELYDKTLAQGVEELLRELNPKVPMTLTWDIQVPKLESGLEDHIFRIVQECVSNTLRHAEAKRLEVYLHDNNGVLRLRIIDDGKGFNPDQESLAGHYGLNNLAERVKNMGGSHQIFSQVGEGTTIDISIPLAAQSITEGRGME
ncbi:sensor histidine kinase [Suicoccus acidiformans]|uniref:Sensor histidine kinase n=1 Tax=Suicoccus acidiformans TaxID=2036206 RepID=A0A347WK38_9LACT|nr:sensor histidine kinase [Suicoccus acidiformans]AXY25445.1 sensor histidine kinase [Suicoccus acidiformans]